MRAQKGREEERLGFLPTSEPGVERHLHAALATMLSIGPGETGAEDFFLETSIRFNRYFHLYRARQKSGP